MKAGDRIRMFRTAAVVDAATGDLYTATFGTIGYVHSMSPKKAPYSALVEFLDGGLRPGQLFLVPYQDIEMAPGSASGELQVGHA